VAGISGGLILTWDGGRSWASAWIDQITEPIACIAKSATYERDITLLAGTSGAGVLRSTDGGRRWRMSNFGLEEYSILALATAGDWSRRQVVFAGTADGVYRSSGGGRAWKAVGLRGLAVQALAAGRKSASKDPAIEGSGGLSDASGAWTILAGTEANGLHRALDGGYTWEPCAREIGHDVGINALLCAAADSGEIWLAGTDGGSIWRSKDNGDTWSQVCQAGGPVLTLGEGHKALLAGTSEQGLWSSIDEGLTWRPDAGLCAWGFRRLDSAGEPILTALAPTGGVWFSTDAGKGWERKIEASLYDPVLAYLPVGVNWLAARAEGVWRGRPGTEPALVLESDKAPIVTIVGTHTPGSAGSIQGSVWAGAADGSLWVSEDEGASWQALEAPFRSQRLLGLAFTPQDGALLAGVVSGDLADERKEVSLWRRDSGGGRWHCWLSRSDTWPGLALSPGGLHGEGIWAALGGKAYAHEESGWREVDIPDHEGAVTVITDVSAAGKRYLISGGEVVAAVAGRDAGGEWQSLPLPHGGSTPVDLCLLASGALLCLDASGVVWRLGVAD
jgi:hypothetical protein